MKSTLFALALITLSGTALAASTDDGKQPVVEDYRYSMQLDVARIISMSDNSYCGIGTREMTYVDSSGVTRILRYQAFGDGCIDQS